MRKLFESSRILMVSLSAALPIREKHDPPFRSRSHGSLRKYPRTVHTATRILALTTLAVLLSSAVRARQQPRFDRRTVLTMLDEVAVDIQKHYYDQKFHEVNWNAQILEARKKIESDNSFNGPMVDLTAALNSLHDPQTFLAPALKSAPYAYGLRAEMVGDTCYIAGVRPGTDAEVQGVKSGDQVLAINGIKPTRDILWKLDYSFQASIPQTEFELTLRHADGQEREAWVAAKMLVGSKVGKFGWMLPRETEIGNELMILNVPQFYYDPGRIDWILGKAREHRALIIDLRGSSGGNVEMLEALVGGIFENDVKIADRMGRKEMKPEVAKSRGSEAFTGKLVVLVDSKTASSAELFARLVQLHKRGLVLGDLSAGRVMETKDYYHRLGGADDYSISITQADLIMTDGKSLEHRGVTPDETVLPTAVDLVNDRDPVLSLAASLLGVKLSPEDAGKLFPFEWRQPPRLSIHPEGTAIESPEPTRVQ